MNISTSTPTADEQHFGANRYVYCNQHLRAHVTGWCTVGNHNKTLLDSTDGHGAAAECRAKGFKLYEDINRG